MLNSSRDPVSVICTLPKPRWSLSLSLSSWHNLQGGAIIRRASWPHLGSCCKFWSPFNSCLIQQRKQWPYYSVRYGVYFSFTSSLCSLLLPYTLIYSIYVYYTYSYTFSSSISPCCRPPSLPSLKKQFNFLSR